MIFNFFKYLEERGIDYCILNGYREIISRGATDGDIDILFKKQDFFNIERVINSFCKDYNYQIVQNYHQELLAKNFFIFNPNTLELLNLDIYGELSRAGILLFKEDEVFNSLERFKGIPILSPEKELISYLVKKLDKYDVPFETFQHLTSLYQKNPLLSEDLIRFFFPKTYQIITGVFKEKKFKEIQKNIGLFRNDFRKGRSGSFGIKDYFLEAERFVKRIIEPTGLTISFLGPDGSGKSTIINELMKMTLPYRRKAYFHLKPLLKKEKNNNEAIVVSDPHQHPVYSKLKSYLKLFYFVIQYNFGWIKNIYPMKIRSTLVIFDRYFDDLLIDNRRYRYGGSISFAKFIRNFVPKPEIYFILTSDAETIYKRKQEVSFKELEHQIKGYNAFTDHKRYFQIDINRTPEEITKEVVKIIMQKMNERY